MRTLLFAIALSAAGPALAGGCFIAPGTPADRDVPGYMGSANVPGDCATPAVFADPVCWDEEGMRLLMQWRDGSPSCMSAAEALAMYYRPACAQRANAALDALVAQELPTLTERLAVATKPVTPGYELRGQWSDWLLTRRDAYVQALHAAATVNDLSPCPDYGYAPFGEWEAAQ